MKRGVTATSPPSSVVTSDAIDQGQSPQEVVSESTRLLVKSSSSVQSALTTAGSTRPSDLLYYNPDQTPTEEYKTLIAQCKQYEIVQYVLTAFYIVVAILYASFGSWQNIQTLTSNAKLVYHDISVPSLNISFPPFSLECPDANNLLHVEWIGFVLFLAMAANALGTALFTARERKEWEQTRITFDSNLFCGFRPMNLVRGLTAFTMLYAFIMQQAGVPNVGLQYFYGIALGATSEYLWSIQERIRHVSWMPYIGMWVLGALGWGWLMAQAYWTLKAYGSQSNNLSGAMILLVLMMWIVMGAIRGVDLIKWIPRSTYNSHVDFTVLYIYDGVSGTIVTIVMWILFYQLAKDVPIVAPTVLCL